MHKYVHNSQNYFWKIKLILLVNYIYMAKSNANKTTSPKAAKAASDVLNDDRTGKKSKTAAGSALSQKESKKK